MRSETIVGLLVLAVIPASAELPQTVRELTDSVADTSSMTWEGRWTLARDLWMAPTSGLSLEERLFINGKAIEAHPQHFDARWTRVGLIEDAEHLSREDRIAALHRLIDDTRAQDPGPHSDIASEWLRALIYGLRAVSDLSGDPTQLTEARQLARDYLRRPPDCDADWIFNDFLGVTAGRPEEQWQHYSAGLERCPDSKLTATFYMRMIELSKSIDGVGSPTEVAQLLQGWSAYIDRWKEAVRGSPGSKSYLTSQLYQGFTAVDYYTATGGDHSLRRQWLAVVRSALDEDDAEYPWFETRYHYRSALLELELGNREAALSHVGTALSIGDPHRSQWASRDHELTEIVLHLDSLRVMLDDAHRR